MPFARWIATLGFFFFILGSLNAEEPMTWEMIRARIAPILADVPTTGLLVFDVIKGSQAAKAGIQLGDIVTHYDGQPVSHHQELMNLAKVANNEKRAEVLVIVRRGAETVEFTLSPGPMGVRLEDVAEGEKRFLPPRVGMVGQLPNIDVIRAMVADNSHHWQLVYSDADASKPIGWTHHYLTERPGDGPVLRIQQQLAVGDRMIRQDVVVAFRFDPLLSPRSLLLSVDDKMLLDFEREGDVANGHRVGVPVKVAMSRDVVSSYLAPYIAAAMNAGGTDRLDVSVLMPASLEAAPLGEFNRDPKTNEVVLTTLGREEMRIEHNPNGSLGTMRMRGGLLLKPSHSEEVATRFAESVNLFTAIEKLPTLPEIPALKAN